MRENEIKEISYVINKMFEGIVSWCVAIGNSGNGYGLFTPCKYQFQPFGAKDTAKICLLKKVGIVSQEIAELSSLLATKILDGRNC